MPTIDTPIDCLFWGYTEEEQCGMPLSGEPLITVQDVPGSGHWVLGPHPGTGAQHPAQMQVSPLLLVGIGLAALWLMGKGK